MRESCESVKRERDDLRFQLDAEREERERQQERERREREQQRIEARRRASPSNRLYNGEVADFDDAVRCHVAACQQEITSPAADDDEDMRQTIENCNQTLNKSIAQAHRARAIYDQIASETEKRIAEALRSESLNDWANCLESGDYSPMAV